MATIATLMAGSIVSYSLDVDTPAWVVLNGVISVGAVGKIAESKDKTTLADVEGKTGAGLPQAPDRDIKGQFMGSDTDQKAFLDAVSALSNVLVKVDYADKPDATGTGSIREMELSTLGYELDDVTGEEWMMFTAKTKQQSLTKTDPVAGV